MRYFFVSVTFDLVDKINFSNYGLRFNRFPTLDDIKEKILSVNPLAEDMVILSISELNENDYNTLFNKSR